MSRSSGFILFVVIILSLAVSLSISGQMNAREVIINIPAFILYLYENGIPIRAYPIGIGNEVKPSQLGSTKIINRVINPTYYPPRWWERGLEPIPPGDDNPVGTRWLGLGFPSYGIHGTNNPDSIGKAMSAGCIRMYNHHVEELTQLVSVGTPVSLIYETILLVKDPLLQTQQITIHPDIYHTGVNTMERVEYLLEREKWTDVHIPVLTRMITHASGKPQPLPISKPITLNGEIIEAAAVKYGQHYYAPLRPTIPIDKPAKTFVNTMWWDALYVELQELTNTFGLGYEVHQQIELFTVTLYLDAEPLDIKPHILNNQLYLPVDALSLQIGLPIVAHIKENVILIDGTEYLGQMITSQWGFTVDWQHPDQEATINIPRVYLDDILLGIAIKNDQDELYVPINRVEQLLEIELEWLADEQILLVQGTYGIEALSAGDLIYVPDWVIHWLMPGAGLQVVYP